MEFSKKMYPLVRPLLFSLPAETAHDLTLKFLKTFSPCCKAKHFHQPKTVMGLEFPNPLGLAAGLDKNGDYIDALAKLGFGFVEIGTVTPKPQLGNSKPRLFRLPQAHALLNHMGFNNKGVDYLIKQVRQAKYKGILGINIGKNRTTPNDQAVDDYVTCLKKVYTYASYVTVNISSPNTPELRQLQQQAHLPHLLSQLKHVQSDCAAKHGKHVPLVIKISPDIPLADVPILAQTLIEHQCEGVIVSNTTATRPGITTLKHADRPGGLSGKPLFALSNQVLQALAQTLAGKIPIIGTGGIMSALDAQTKLDLGANLLQLYTGLIYHGPGLIKDILTKLP